MKLTKLQTAALVGIPVIIGGYLIYKQLRKPKPNGLSDVIPPPSPSNNNNNNQTPASNFPLKKGSKNESVGTLQGLLNTSNLVNPKLVVDNSFGSKTETALLAAYGKNQIDDQTDLDNLRTKLSKENSKSANLDWAWQLIDAYNTGKYSSLKVKQKITLYGVDKNFQNQWERNNKNINLAAHNYGLNDYALRSATTDGSIRIEVLRGAFAGMYITDASINNKNTFSII
jgi:hypothetical protein